MWATTSRLPPMGHTLSMEHSSGCQLSSPAKKTSPQVEERLPLTLDQSDFKDNLLTPRLQFKFQLSGDDLTSVAVVKTSVNM